MTDDRPEITHSPLGGRVTRDGISVDVEIYRLTDGSPEWTLEVVDDLGGATVWDETFSTDLDAYREFERVLDEEGIHTFRDAPPDQSVH